MNWHDETYKFLLRHILTNGEERTDRTGVGTKAVFGHQMFFNLNEGFPLLTTKRVWWKGVVEELLWFLRGETNVRSLQEKGVHIWDEWADENGELGPVYGAQWRNWRGVSSDGKSFAVDQINQLIAGLIGNPDSRRHIVTAWNPMDLPDMALPPCHCLFQFDVTADGKLNCQLYQRSADVFLGVPFNIASYALLTHMVAHVVDLDVGTFVWTGGNVHIYLNHTDQVKEQLSREPRAAPSLALNPEVKDISAFRAEDISLADYNPHPTITAEVAV